MRCDDLLRQTSALPLSQSSAAMCAFKASDARDRIFATLRLAVIQQTSIQPPVADYSLTVQEVYTNAARYFIDVYKGPELWGVGNRHSTKTIPGLPSWAPDFTRRWDMQENPLLESVPAFASFIQARPTTTPTSLYVDAYMMDKIFSRISITRETDAYSIVKSMAQALARCGRRVYEGRGASGKKGEIGREKKSSRSKAMVFRRPKRVNTKRLPDTTDEDTEEDNKAQTNGQALLTAIFTQNGVSAEEHAEAAAFLAWKLSTDKDIPKSARKPPVYLQSLVAAWETRSQARKDFDLTICQKMEGRLRYDADLVYTEKGNFGLTNKGEAEEGMAIALVGGSRYLTLLRERKDDSQERWYEYVDRVFMDHLDGNIKTLDQIDKNAIIERLEIR